MDRISDLPEFIVHHILYCLIPSDAPPADLVRMSVSSKKWFALTASFPILDFCGFRLTSRETFFKYVEYTTSRFCHQNVTAHAFKLATIVKEPADIDTANKWLELGLQNGVREIVIYVHYKLRRGSVRKCRLPNILLSVSSVLNSLDVLGCELSSSLMVDAVKFKSLTCLVLEDVYIDDEVIKYLNASCPLLEILKIQRCYGFKHLCVYGHQNLQQVWFGYINPDVIIDIELPNLSHLWIEERDTKSDTKSLRTLSMHHMTYYCVLISSQKRVPCSGCSDIFLIPHFLRLFDGCPVSFCNFDN